MQSIAIDDLSSLVSERLEDAKALYAATRYAGAIYICGYAIELGLKKKICETLGWNEFPTDDKYKTLKTHKLEVLLHFSGVERMINKRYKAEWSAVMKWDPESRYSAIALGEADAKLMIESTEALLNAL